MNLVNFIFGERPSSTLLTEVPDDAEWRYVHPKPDQPAVRARRAEADCTVTTAQGKLKARGGRDYIVTYDFDDHAVIDGDIFARTYEPLDGGLFRKRSDVTLRYFTLDYPCIVQTKEGPQRAAAGDWIMEGVIGELWPVPRAKAHQKYDPI